MIKIFLLILLSGSVAGQFNMNIGTTIAGGKFTTETLQKVAKEQVTSAWNSHLKNGGNINTQFGLVSGDLMNTFDENHKSEESSHWNCMVGIGIAFSSKEKFTNLILVTIDVIGFSQLWAPSGGSVSPVSNFHILLYETPGTSPQPEVKPPQPEVKKKKASKKSGPR
ncbi:hypothetical protein Ddc_18035 [Ditylenchus destructor]|nr:hypothetical protein Ddc_18035 [Ditylenchus destructor]